MRARLIACLILLSFGIVDFSRRVSAQDSQATIRAEVALVDVVFTATDRNGHPVRGLKADDFQIFEDKTPQKIEYFSYPRKRE